MTSGWKNRLCHRWPRASHGGVAAWQSSTVDDMLDRVKLDLSFDPKLLQEDLQRLQSSDWIGHFVQQNYDGDWSVIALRGPAAATHPVMMIYSDPSCTELADTPCH